MTQTIGGLVAGQWYTLSFAYSNNPYYGGTYQYNPAAATVTVTEGLSGPTPISTVITHGTAHPDPPGPAVPLSWAAYTQNFQLDAGYSSVTLTFQSNSASTGQTVFSGILLDQVSLIPTPEPSSLALAGGMGGLGLLFWARRLRRRPV